MAEMIQLTESAFRQRTRMVLTTPNVNFVAAVQTDEAFRDAVVRSDVVVVDGMPLVWLARLAGVKTSRLAGATFFERLTEGDAGVFKVFFFGGGEDVAERASRRLRVSSGAARGVGGLYPGFGSVEQMAAREVVDAINDAEPDFVVVSLGAAKGQAWIEHTQYELNAPVISHLGAVVNFLAGTVKRAPWILQVSGFEWCWRIIEEPALWRRYYRDATTLARLVCGSTLPLLWQRWRANYQPAQPARITFSPPAAEGPARLVMAGDWRRGDWTLLADMLNRATCVPCNVLIDAHALGRVDQATVAQLIRLRGHQQRLGLRLDFLQPSASFAAALRLHCAAYLLQPQSVQPEGSLMPVAA
jgi:N-acetylglucosaminyldiphosphoundecaprenol N-acetyl-beta-D-mannosaminyltransferase